MNQRPGRSLWAPHTTIPQRSSVGHSCRQDEEHPGDVVRQSLPSGAPSMKRGGRCVIGSPKIRSNLIYRAFGRGAGVAGVPVVAGAFSGIQVIAVRSYLNAGAFFNASLHRLAR